MSASLHEVDLRCALKFLNEYSAPADFDLKAAVGQLLDQVLA